jgi:radical SAM protein with 4Fe4S-binding SPASM domain
MATRSRVPARFIAKDLLKVMLTDQRTFANLVGLQIAKETFDLRHPFGTAHGRGDKVRQVSLRITDLCNLRCHTCGQWGDHGYLLDKPLKDLKQNEVDVAVYKRLADQFVDQGWSPIWYIWGGEPMLYPGMIDLLYYISERNMPIMMVSNGTRIAQHAKEIVDTCNNIWLSLDGPNAEIHNQQRPGVSASMDNFKMVEEALIALNEEKMRRHSVYPYISPISVVASYNIDYLVDIHHFARQYADSHIFYLSWWIDEESAADHSRDFQRRFGFEPHTHLGWLGSWKDFDHNLVYDKFQEIYQIFDNYQHNPNGYKRCVPLMYPHLSTREDIRLYYEDHHAVFGYEQCVSIFMTMEIDSNGDVSLCRDYHDYIIGNIKNQSLMEIWDSEESRKFRASISTEGLMPVCRRCCGLMGY